VETKSGEVTIRTAEKECFGLAVSSASRFLTAEASDLKILGL
jgi:hypothetical protein